MSAPAPAEPSAIHHLSCTHPGGTHRMAWREWLPVGQAERGTVVCVHGLTRNGGDFDHLAGVLTRDGYRVVCPDIVGRGLSERLPNAGLYDIPQYASDCVTLLNALGRERVDWVGTSLGGLIGMAIIGGGEREATTPVIARLLLNDIGPVIARAGLRRISGYVGDSRRYSDFATAEASLRERMVSFGPHDDDAFRLLSRHYFVERDGGWCAHYDPAIAAAFSAMPDEEIAMWPLWYAIDCPVTVLRGEESDLLDATTARLMTRGGPDGSGPRAELVTVAGVGHAPTLIADDQVAAVRRFLGGADGAPNDGADDDTASHDGADDDTADHAGTDDPAGEKRLERTLG